MAGKGTHERLPETTVSSRRAELFTFLILAFGVWPFVAIAVVGSFGLLVWILQMIFGPPGPPTATP